MAYNSTVELIGNMSKSGVRLIKTEESKFAAFSLATTDSYKDRESGEWINKETVWHDLIVFNPKVIESLKELDSKSRIKVTGTLNYRPLTVEIDFEENGKASTKVITKKEASIVVRKVET
jgi:single-stranded DNA-binding protein